MNTNNINPNPIAPKDDAKQRTILIAALLLLLLGGLNVVQMWRGKQSTQQVTQVMGEKDATLADLRQTNDLLKTQLDSLKNTNASLSTEIDRYKTELDAKEASIVRTIQSGDIGEARRQIAELVQQKAAYADEIARLKSSVATLKLDYETVSGERNQAATERDELFNKASRSEAELAEAKSLVEDLAAAKDLAERENAKAQAVVEANKFLNVTNIQVQAKHVSKKGDKSKDTKFAKSVDKIEIKFTVQPNQFVPAGKETFHIRIVAVNATGTTLNGDQNQPLKDKDSGTEYQFTTAASCDYTQIETEVKGDWNIGENKLAHGEYNVEVFNRGRKVGTGKFKVK